MWYVEPCYFEHLISVLPSYYQSRNQRPTQAPPPHPSHPWPINTSQCPVTDGCRGQWRLPRVGRGLTKVRPGTGGGLGLLWHGLSVCQYAGGWVACGLHPPAPTPYFPKVRALIAGQEAKMEVFSEHPRPVPKNLRVQLTQHPFAPALETCSNKSWRAGKANMGYWWNWPVCNHE